MKNWKNLFGRNLGMFLAAAFFTLVDCIPLQAQNVTIRGNNGSMIASMAKPGNEDLGYKSGGFATWQHEQLSMVLTTADHSNLTTNGQLDNPANNLYTDGDKMQICKGSGLGYVSLSLPKGYRFTGYSITFKKPGELTKGSGANNTVQFNKNNNNSVFGETNSTFSSYITQATARQGGASVTISRTAKNEEDMGNVLYFLLGPESDSFEIITLESAEFFFTAEDNYSPVTPAGTISSPVSAVNIPFSTSKVDYGNILQTTYYGNSRISYSSANVKDMEANFVLYEEGSIKDGEDIDSVSGKIVDYKAGSISSAGGFFKLGKDGEQQIYYIESPTYVELSDGTKNPVGYRIVEAEFEYTNQATAHRTFYITYNYNGTTYYLYRSGSEVSWETRTSRRTLWEMDKDGYISAGGYYMYFNNGYVGLQRQKPAETERFGINENGIYQLQWPDYYICYYFSYNSWSSYALISKDSQNKASYDEQSIDESNYDYTLYIYDKEGNNPQEIEVNSNNASGKVPLTGLNNDAVKFGVKGIGLVRATLTLQALNPYLDDMKVVCSSEAQTDIPIRIEQTFTASDFSVNGGEFYFYLPSELNNQPVDITFEDLHSKYFDESYDGGSDKNTSRLNFVKSEHYNVFGATNNKIYNDVNEAKNPQKERLKVGTVGTAKFKFNNADEVGTSGGTLTEYPFSLEKYAAKPNYGEFENMKFTVRDTDQVRTRYVFTTDETRYNIAPTTAIQHRAYAFYEMIIHVQSKSYEPKVEFTKIYDNTYRTGQVNEPFYGAKVTAIDGNGKPGYASTKSIFEAIDRCINTDKEDDYGNKDIPADQKHLLYLDFSSLKGIYQIVDEEHQSMEDFSAENAANCMIFLPEGSSAPNNNVSAKQKDGSFKAVRNIILTDKEPFYTPYDIQVDAANIAKHERLITNAKNGKVTSATIIMPFDIKIDSEGKHTNADETEPAFSLHTMKATDCISKDAPDGAIPESVASYAFFPTVNNVTLSEPNKPYIVKVLNPSDGDKTSFVITQKGATIKATTTGMNSDYTFTGETATGSLDGKTYNFTNLGTFSGIQVDKTKGYYYFAQNKFVCSNDLDDRWDVVGIYPFRAYYATGTQNANLMSTFAIVFGEGEGNTDPTGINNVDETPDLVVAPGVGTMTMASTIEQGVKIYNMNGVLVDKVVMGAGETKTVNLPAGMYIVNGTKLIVR